MPRLPRFKRSPEIKPLRLTDRDREILHHVHHHRFLRSDHITALTLGSRQQTLRRLQRLYHHGYLERPRCQIDYYQSGSRRMAYGLGNKGAVWVKRKLALPYHKLDWIRKNRVGRLFLEHALLISDVMVAVELACRQRNDVRLLAPDDSNREQWSVTVDRRQKCGVVPDRIFGLEFNGKQCWFFLEADRSTMPVRRTELTKSSFYRKVLAYEATWAQNIHRIRFNWNRFRVLTVTDNPHRIVTMREAVSKLDRGHGLFLFLDANLLKEQKDFFGLSWRTFRDNKTTLLPE